MTHTHDHQHVFEDPAHVDMLDLDAELFAGFLEEATGLAARFAPDGVRTVVDLGAGSGTGTAWLARRFPDAELVAVDNSPYMLERLRARPDVGARTRTIEADADAGWPDTGRPDVIWTAGALHHFRDPERVLRDAHAALSPGGVLAAVEMDHHPRFLSDDAGVALEDRLREVIVAAGWNDHPDWRPALERAGFDVVEQRSLRTDPDPLPPQAPRYAHGFYARVRSTLGERLPAGDRAALDALLGDGPDSLRHRDLTVRGSRTVWVARAQAPVTS